MRRAAVMLAAVVVGGTPGAGARGAQDAYRSGRYREALMLWAPRAVVGDPIAQLGLGMLFDLGRGVARDPVKAHQWYRRAARSGLPEAEFDVAVIDDTGDGVPRDAARAALWYARAATHGDHRAQYNLGQLYASGDGMPRNRDAAEAWFRAAASLPAAAARLAVMQRHDSGRLPRGGSARSTALRRAHLRGPADGASIARMPDAATVELVWTAPSQALPVRFFVQLLALRKGAPAREVFATYVDTTAVLAPVQSPPGQYAWRVYTVSHDRRMYAASGWNWFQVRAAQ